MMKKALKLWRKQLIRKAKEEKTIGMPIKVKCDNAALGNVLLFTIKCGKLLPRKTKVNTWL